MITDSVFNWQPTVRIKFDAAQWPHWEVLPCR